MAPSSNIQVPILRPSLENMLAEDNPDVVRRYMDKLNLTKPEADLLFADTKRFLFICGTIPGYWVPPEKIDTAWHEFILFTRDYADFCAGYFGRFIHHEPTRITENRLQLSDIRATLIAARELFGDDLSVNWVAHGLSVQDLISRQDLVVAGDPCSGAPGHPSCGCSAPSVDN